MSKNDELRKRLYAMLQKEPNLPKSTIVQRFMDMRVSRATVFRWLQRYEQTGSVARVSNPGRPTRIASKSTLQKLKKNFNHRSGCSQRAAARELGCSQQYVSHMIRKHTSIRCYKKYKRPLLTRLQKEQARPKCRAMYHLYGNSDFIIDDESYFTLTGADQPGNDRFYSSDVERTPDTVKNNYREKYPPKLLVWLAISPKGMTQPVFRQSGLAVNSDAYLQILEKYLIPFIKKKYKGTRYVFWPDLATAHYSNKVRNFLKDQKVPLVLKSVNPANLPKVRPIEDFWANLKADVYKGDWKAKNLNELEKRIRLCLRKMSPKFVQRHAESVKKRLDNIRRYGNQ